MFDKKTKLILLIFFLNFTIIYSQNIGSGFSLNFPRYSIKFLTENADSPEKSITGDGYNEYGPNSAVEPIYHQPIKSIQYQSKQPIQHQQNQPIIPNHYQSIPPINQQEYQQIAPITANDQQQYQPIEIHNQQYRPIESIHHQQHQQIIPSHHQSLALINKQEYQPIASNDEQQYQPVEIHQQQHQPYQQIAPIRHQQYEPIETDNQPQYKPLVHKISYPQYKPIEIYYNKYQPKEFVPEQPSKYPIIHREPIETETCIKMVDHQPNPEDSYEPILQLAKSASRKRNQEIYYYGSLGNWANNQNILREGEPEYLEEDQVIQNSDPNLVVYETDPRFADVDPRSFIHSSSHFVKIKEPFIGSKVIISKEKIIGRPSGENFHHFNEFDFGGHHHHHGHPGHFSDPNIQNIHKNTHIHFQNRNANTEQVGFQANDPLVGQAKDPRYNEKIVGSHLFAAPRWQRDLVSRKKRGVLDAMKLVTDHRTKIDIPKTAENVGAATKKVFEEDYSPVYHLRNALSSAHDVMYSLLNVRPHGILIPCRYRIVDGNEVPSSQIVGAINPELYRKHGLAPPEGIPPPTASFKQDNSDFEGEQSFYGEDPMQKIGKALRNSVTWAHKSAEHVADAIHSSRKAYVNARRNWAKLLTPYVGSIAVIKHPIGRKVEDQDIVGTPRDPEFVGIGKMMDYLGMTNEKPEYLPLVGAARYPITEEEMILQKAKDSLGAPTYQHILAAIKKEVDIHQKAKDIVGAQQFTAQSLKTKLALDRLQTRLKIQKAKADLKMRQAHLPKLIHKPKSPLLRLETPSEKKPLIPNLKLPTSSLPKSPIIKPDTSAKKNPTFNLKPTATLGKTAATETKLDAKEKLAKVLEGVKEKLNKRFNLSNEEITPKEENSKEMVAKALEDIRDKLNKRLNISNDEMKPKTEDRKEKLTKTLQHLRDKINTRLNIEIPENPNKKDVENVGKTLEDFKQNIYENYNIPVDGENTDILGKALAKFRNSQVNAENIGAPNSQNKEPVKSFSPVFTQEMKTPFMGIPTKEEIDKYFQKIYGS